MFLLMETKKKDTLIVIYHLVMNEKLVDLVFFCFFTPFMFT